MKHIKKVFAFALTIVMAFALALPAFAEDGDNNSSTTSGTITVNNAIDGETYQLYKVFDATVKEGRADGGTGISYSSTWLTESNDYFAVDSKGNITITNAGKGADGNLSADAIDWLKGNISNFTAIGDPQTAVNNKVEWTGLEEGYYYISTSTGSFVTVDSLSPDATVQEKNTVTKEDKKQGTEAGKYANADLELNIGDTVYYDVDITVGKGANKEIKLTDALSAGLTLNQDSITVKIGDTDVAPESYTLTTNAQGFVLTLNREYVASLDADTVINVEYSAVINSSAVIHDANTNTATLEYSNQTQEDSTTVKTYDFLVHKTDGSVFLNGAGFKLYDAETGGNQIAVAHDSTGYYVDQSAKKDITVEIMVDSANGVNVRGLKPGTYYLEETTTPNGYNTLTSRQAFEIAPNATAAVEVTVENHAGTELPSTGGIGTTIFYIVGGIMVVGAVVVLLAKRRASSTEE